MMKETVMSHSLRLMFSGGLALGIGLMAQPAIAQVTAPTSAGPAATTDAPAIQRVEITGTSIKRVAEEGALPVQTVTHAEIEKLGVTTPEELIKTLSANSTVQGTFTGANAGLQTFSLASASLRGLGQNKTLILVNGRRLANYATDGTTVDINSIPLGTVDHVDVLKDGASAIYGSDAIAGVINFILRKDFTGFEVTGQTGGSTAGGGATTQAGFVWGFGDIDKDRYNVMLSADFSKETPIYGRQRSYANQSSDEVNGLFDQSATPSGALRTFDPVTTPDANGLIPNALNSQGRGRGNPLSPDNCAQNGSYFDQAIGTCRFNASPFVPLTPDVQRQNLSGNFHFKLDDKNEFYIDSFVSHKIATVFEQPSPYSVSFMATDQAFATRNIYPAIILSPTNPNYPAAFLAANGRPTDVPYTVSYRAFDGGNRHFTDTTDQIHVATGFRGIFLKNYDYDIAYVHNSSTVHENTQSGYQSQTAIATLLSNNDAFNPFTKFQTPALAAQIAATNYIGNMMDAKLSTDSVEGKVSGNLFKMPAGMANFALGGLVRNESFDFTPSAAFQSGDISGYGGQALPLGVERHSLSAYGELAVPLLKSLDGDIAIRTDKYPGVTTTNPKFSLRYQPISQLLFRTSYGKGFREASLPELFTPNTIGTTAVFTDPVTGVENQFTQTIGGNANLSPEKSKQWSIGIVADVTKDLSVAVDYWNVRITDLVTSLSPQFIVNQAAANNPTYTGLVSRDAVGNITNITATNINAGGINTSGIDVDLRWRIAKTENMGTFSTHVNGTYTRKYDYILPDGTVQPSVGVTVDADGNPLNAVAAGGILFKWKHQLSFDWTRGVVGASLIQNYQSGYYDSIPFINGGFSPLTVPTHIGSLSTWDLQASYGGVRNLVLRLGMRNMFNKKPPVITGLGNYFQTGYDPSYYDPHGRDIYVTAKYTF